MTENSEFFEKNYVRPDGDKTWNTAGDDACVIDNIKNILRLE